MYIQGFYRLNRDPYQLHGNTSIYICTQSLCIASRRAALIKMNHSNRTSAEKGTECFGEEACHVEGKDVLPFPQAALFAVTNYECSVIHAVMQRDGDR